MWDEAFADHNLFTRLFKKRIKIIGKWRIESGHYIPAPYYFIYVWKWDKSF